jgi:hypothetical protein
MPSAFRPIARIVSILLTTLAVHAQAPEAVKEQHGLPARATPADYQVQAKLDQYTLAAEFTGHGIPNEAEALNSEEYVAVELALFGPPDSRLTISASEFSLRINGKKEALPSQPWGLVARNIKDPEWISPEATAESKSKGGISGGGGTGRGPGDPPPLPPKVPVDVLRGWQQRLRRAAIAEGDRALPQAGLIFFQHRGKLESIRSVELLYKGPAGSATLTLR